MPKSGVSKRHTRREAGAQSQGSSIEARPATDTHNSFVPTWMAAKHGGFSVPLVIHPRVRKTVGRIAALTCAAVFVSAGAAFAAQCPTQSAKQKFTKFGDSSNYFLVPGGSFEGTEAQVGWTLSGATLTSGNEPFP